MIDEPLKVPNVKVYGGDTVVFPTYTLLEADGTPVDLTGWVFTASWRRTPRSSVSIPLLVEIADPTSGLIKITASSSNTVAMGASGVWDVQGMLDGVTRTVVYGKTEYIRDVTR